MKPSWLFAALSLGPACVVGATQESPSPDTPEPTTPVLESIAGGSFQGVAPYAGFYGRAVMARRLDGKTMVSIAVTGVAPNVTHVAHVHVAPCAAGAGGHYKLDPTLTTPSEDNELWLEGPASEKGTFVADAMFDHKTRGDALSVVVHDSTTGAKMACADLIADDPDTLVLGSTVSAFPTNAPGDKTIAGTVRATRTTTSTAFELMLSGLDPTSLGYPVHVHNEPCSVASGGDHYKLDPAATDGVETNEISLAIASYATGTSSATIAIPHAIRTDAQSVVVHRTVAVGNAPRVACADLQRTTAYASLESEGPATLLPPGAGLSLSGTAIMTRKLTGVTSVALLATGLTPGTLYHAHVHAQPCAADAGGGHYKIDRAGGGEDNEVTFDLTADADGAAHDSTWFAATAGADAASLVVHGVDGAKLACFDLQ
jgi:hypothetical protein